jgi:2,4-dienoyl-CoA reductase-like NADH-dependent reductase (Old Yellow Enzyme family)
MTMLFSPLTLRTTTLKNRIGVSPMCMYSSVDGFANDWHRQHVGARVAGGAGLFIMEATAVTPDGRITPACHGIWSDAHIEPLKPVTAFARAHDCVIGIQLAHAGRKGSTQTPWAGSGFVPLSDGGWETAAPSAVAYNGYATPRAMTADDIRRMVDAFAASAVRAVRAGFQLLEIHGAHGYLLHEFLSPVSNRRDDDWGGSLENRARFILDVADAIRAAVPSDIIVGARLSCVDWVDGGLQIDDSVRVAGWLKSRGVDFIDCSSGAISADARAEARPGFQVPFAAEIRKSAGLPTAAVGMIAEARQAEDILQAGHADMILLARAFLDDPNWAIHAAIALGADAPVPPQYLRGFNLKQVDGKRKSA